MTQVLTTALEALVKMVATASMLTMTTIANVLDTGLVQTVRSTTLRQTTATQIRVCMGLVTINQPCMNAIVTQNMVE